MKPIPALLAAALLTATPASAATLAALLTGDSITAGDVTFHSFEFSPGDDAGSIPVDAGAVDVTGGSSADEVFLDFAFDPALEVSGDVDTIDYLFSFLASVDAASMRSIVGVTLSFLGDEIDAEIDAAAAVNMTVDNALFLSIFDDSLGGTKASDSAPAGPDTSASFETRWTLIGFDPASIARISGYRLALMLEGDIAPPQIPLPAAAPLFFAGLAGIATIRRRRKETRSLAGCSRI